VLRLVQEQREARYKLLRGFFRGADDGTAEELQHERLASVLLPLTAKSLGRTVGDIDWDNLGVQLVSLRRKTGQVIKLADDLVLMEGDSLLLSGKADMLEQAERLLLKGGF
ncbi:MAG: TrkA C-terminal domain-containing protein, partial [Rhodoferax sp.]|uniref:cation:proton antiporter regulatory subunit n=1 Tax=Rhodoferax sp. TaxID=50421 RepID=UPI00273442DC